MSASEQPRLLGNLAYIVFRQQAWAKLQVVIEIKGATGLEPRSKRSDGRCLSELFHASDASKLLVGVLR